MVNREENEHTTAEFEIDESEQYNADPEKGGQE
jgi:hypothetical protein